MTILITGGLGFIGSHVAKDHLDNGVPVVVTRYGAERVAPFLVDFVGKGLTIEPLDLGNAAAVLDAFRRHEVDSVIHLAAAPIDGVGPGDAYRINMNGLVNIMEAARIAGARRVSIASSIAVYFGLSGPLREDAKVSLAPVHPVEAFKKAEEILGLYLASQPGPKMVALRLGSIYGPLYRGLRHWPARIVHAAVGSGGGLLENGAAGTIHREDHATDLCYVADCARGIRLVHGSERLRHRVYNIGGGQFTTLGEVGEIGARLFPNVSIDMKAGTGERNWLASTMALDRAREDAGYEPQFSIEAAMLAYADWLRQGHAY